MGPLACTPISSPSRRAACNVVIVIVIVIVIVTAVTTIFPPLFCDLFDCCVCSFIMSSPLPHPVVAIPPTASAIVVVVVVTVVAVVAVFAVAVVAYYPPLRVICLIVVCTCPRPSSCHLPVAPPRPLHFTSFVDC